ncbi:MAG: protein phosphatase 2C domain-containing protein, partial [Anaerolineae bacterium]
MDLQQPPPRWKVIGKSVRGEAHKREGKPCQDAIQWHQGDEFAVLAVADGHGSERSPYSDRGAQFTVEVAVELLRSLYAGSSSVSDIKHYAEEQLPKKIVREWTE